MPQKIAITLRVMFIYCIVIDLIVLVLDPTSCIDLLGGSMIPWDAPAR